MPRSTERGTIWDTTPELFDRMMAVNVRAPFFLMQDAIHIMQREGIAGSIINISSVSAYGSVPMLSAYAASKAALNILTKNVAYTVMRKRIRVNALALGWMDTPGEATIQQRYHTDDPDWLAKAEANQPFGRLLKPDEVARAIAYLASDESGLDDRQHHRLRPVGRRGRPAADSATARRMDTRCRRPLRIEGAARMSITIRTVVPDDAEAITAFFLAVDNETKFLLFEPGERTRGPDGWRTRIEEIRGEDHNEIFVAV